MAVAAALVTGGLATGASAATAPTVHRGLSSTAPALHHRLPTHPRLLSRASVLERRAAFGRAVMAEAGRHAGAPYVYGAAGPWAFDCSGFVRFVYARMGIPLPHSSYGQFAVVRHIPQSAALPGDIVFLDGLGHVGLYAGHGMMWDAPSPGGHVSLRPIYSSVFQVGRVPL